MILYGLSIFLIIIVVTTIFAVLHYLYYIYGWYGRHLNKIPGPQLLPFVGSLYKFRGTTEDTWNALRECSKKYYPIWTVWSVLLPCINISHPDDLELLLGNHKYNYKSQIYRLLEAWFGTGLLTSSGPKWQMRRKILTPAFHFHVLQQFSEVMVEGAECMVAELKSVKGPRVENLLPLISNHTLNVICETAMGTTLKGRDKKFQLKYKKAVYDIAQLLLYRLLRPWLQNSFVYHLTPNAWRERSALKILHGFTKQIIAERKQYHEATGGKYLAGLDGDNANAQDDVIGVSKKRLAMLDLLIAAQRRGVINDDGIREEVDTFMFEGHDTTAMALCFTLMLLAEHKEIQDRARIEVDEVFSQCDGKLSIGTIQQLTYLDRCIKESLRLYPSVHFISRELYEDLQLKNYFIPAGTLVNVQIYDTHHDPNFWPNPEVYDPDRFLPENTQARHNYAYVPFSAGGRNCIGQRFAMLEMKSLVAYILHNFYLEPIDYLKDVRFITDLVLRPSHPIRTRFVPINRE